MARTFNLRTVLRQIPNSLLGRFFETMKLDCPEIDWSQLRERDINPILVVLNAQAGSDLIPIEGVLRTVHDLANERGLHSLIESAIAFGDSKLAGRIPEQLTAYGRAMWVWLEHREYFDTGNLFYQVDQLSWWGKRNDLPVRPESPSPNAIQELARAISQLLLTQQGRGRVCTVETLERDTMMYYFAYPDDFVQSIQEHDDEQCLAPRSIRSTFSIVFAYDRQDGSLELSARLPSKLKGDLEAEFARIILGVSLDVYDASTAFQLDHLRFERTFREVDLVDGVEVSVRRLRFEVPGSKRLIELVADPTGGARDIYGMMSECLNRERMRVRDLHVRSATLVFEFLASGPCKPGTVSIVIGKRGIGNLRDQSPDRVEVIQKYLRAWEIDVQRTDLPSLEATGTGTAAVA